PQLPRSADQIRHSNGGHHRGQHRVPTWSRTLWKPCGRYPRRGSDAGSPAPVDVAPSACIPGTALLRLIMGPRDHWFARDAIDVFFASTYVVSTASNRVGVRLSGPVLPADRSRGLSSEEMVLGAVQIPRQRS